MEESEESDMLDKGRSEMVEVVSDSGSSDEVELKEGRSSDCDGSIAVVIRVSWNKTSRISITR